MHSFTDWVLLLVCMGAWFRMATGMMADETMTPFEKITMAVFVAPWFAISTIGAFAITFIEVFMSDLEGDASND